MKNMHLNFLISILIMLSCASIASASDFSAYSFKTTYSICGCGFAEGTITIGNSDIMNHTYTVSSDNDFATYAPQIISIATGEAKEVHVFVKPSCGKIGTYKLKTIIAEETGVRKILEQQISITKCQSLSASAVEAGKTVCVGNTTSYRINIANIASYDESVALSLNKLLNAEIEPKNFLLKAGTNTTALVYINPSRKGITDFSILIKAYKSGTSMNIPLSLNAVNCIKPLPETNQTQTESNIAVLIRSYGIYALIGFIILLILLIALARGRKQGDFDESGLENENGKIEITSKLNPKQEKEQKKFNIMREREERRLEKERNSIARIKEKQQNLLDKSRERLQRQKDKELEKKYSTKSREGRGIKSDLYYRSPEAAALHKPVDLRKIIGIIAIIAVIALLVFAVFYFHVPSMIKDIKLPSFLQKKTAGPSAGPQPPLTTGIGLGLKLIINESANTTQNVPPNITAVNTTNQLPTQPVPSQPTVCCKSYGIGAMGVECCQTYKFMPSNECVMPPGYVGGNKQIVPLSYCINETNNETSKPIANNTNITAQVPVKPAKETNLTAAEKACKGNASSYIQINGSKGLLVLSSKEYECSQKYECKQIANTSYYRFDCYFDESDERCHCFSGDSSQCNQDKILTKESGKVTELSCSFMNSGEKLETTSITLFSCPQCSKAFLNAKRFMFAYMYYFIAAFAVLVLLIGFLALKDRKDEQRVQDTKKEAKKARKRRKK